MSKPRAVLEAMEAALEGGKEPARASFVELGMPADGDLESFVPPAGWDIGDRALFHYVRGNYGLYRVTYAEHAVGELGECFNMLVVAKDAARATRAFARLLRECATASFMLPAAFDVASPMLAKLDWMRANAPRRDVEELDLSIAEMFTRMAREGGFHDRHAVARAFALVRSTLTRLMDQPLTRQRALPHAIAGFWLGHDTLWTDADLADPRSWYGGGNRHELRRAAFLKACELADGSTYRVGAAAPVKERKLRDLANHFAHLLTQYATLRDAAGTQAAIARWGGELGGEVVAAALTHAERDATPEPVSPAPERGRANKPTNAPPAAASATAAAPTRSKQPTNPPSAPSAAASTAQVRSKQPANPPAASSATSFATAASAAPARAKEPPNPPAASSATAAPTAPTRSKQSTNPPVASSATAASTAPTRSKQPTNPPAASSATAASTTQTRSKQPTNPPPPPSAPRSSAAPKAPPKAAAKPIAHGTSKSEKPAKATAKKAAATPAKPAKKAAGTPAKAAASKPTSPARKASPKKSR